MALMARSLEAIVSRPSVLRGVLAAGLQQRHAHVGAPVDVPDFSHYRRPSSGVPGTDASRKAFTYVLAGGVGVVGAHTAKNIVQDFLDTMSTSADVKAMAQLEVDLDSIPEGKNMTLKWQGKPLFVRNRTAEEIATVRATDMSLLPDPEKDEDRVESGRDNWLVVLGICTHLGCVPLSHSGDYNGYFCPCHGSHYDASGRIRKGPAPLNLAKPPYKFMSDSLLVVG